ncbi:hypothetical protein AGMMS49949_08150 [Alphaproteobacteria bacterium]|nr:hypothetical protein AGMMS49949_08150 [Alphaproteobacteria bacterium]GHS99260.1 hypothetical protein AGMMS50296_7350 [Alphaproteobacteria bacterium]
MKDAASFFQKYYEFSCQDLFSKEAFEARATSSSSSSSSGLLGEEAEVLTFNTNLLKVPQALEEVSKTLLFLAQFRLTPHRSCKIQTIPEEPGMKSLFETLYDFRESAATCLGPPEEGTRTPVPPEKADIPEFLNVITTFGPPANFEERLQAFLMAMSPSMAQRQKNFLLFLEGQKAFYAKLADQCSALKNYFTEILEKDFESEDLIYRTCWAIQPTQSAYKKICTDLAQTSSRFQGMGNLFLAELKNFSALVCKNLEEENVLLTQIGRNPLLRPENQKEIMSVSEKESWGTKPFAFVKSPEDNIFWYYPPKWNARMQNYFDFAFAERVRVEIDEKTQLIVKPEELRGLPLPQDAYTSLEELVSVLIKNNEGTHKNLQHLNILHGKKLDLL